MLANHPNIVNVLEIVVGDNVNQIFIVMEFVEHDLKALMEGMREPFKPSEIKTIMLQLVRRLSTAFWGVGRGGVADGALLIRPTDLGWGWLGRFRIGGGCR